MALIGDDIRAYMVADNHEHELPLASAVFSHMSSAQVRYARARADALEAFAAELAGRVMELEALVADAQAVYDERLHSTGYFTITLTAALMEELRRGSS